MQAEMIAVQVLSQAGDVQLFQKEPGSSTQIVPVTTISSSELRALTQVKTVMRLTFMLFSTFWFYKSEYKAQKPLGSRIETDNYLV